jgi:hypothetical protein
MDKRPQVYIIVFSIVGFLVYWVVSWYVPMPPITSETEATTAVMHYLRDDPKLDASLADHETSAYYDEDGQWVVTISLDDRDPPFLVFDVDKITGFVRPLPVR